MVAFVGRAVSTVAAGKESAQTTFKIEERLWGELPPDTVTIEGTEVEGKRRHMSLFVLAGRRMDSGSNKWTYFVDFWCCIYGLVLPADHAWAKEFRDNVAQRKPAVMRVQTRSNFIPLAGLEILISEPGFTWQGISREEPVEAKLPPGGYMVLIANANFTLPERAQRASILPGSCADWRIDAMPDSSISGRIVQSREVYASRVSYLLDGELTPDATLLESAFLMLRRSWQAMTGRGGPLTKHTTYTVHPDVGGRFQIPVLPGSYRLRAIPRDWHDSSIPIPQIYYPGVNDPAQAKVIVVPAGGTIADISFPLPDYGRTRRVEVTLVTEEGSAAADKPITFQGKFPGERRTPIWTQTRTDARGRVISDLWHTLDYDIQIGDDLSGDSRHFSAGAEPVSRRFVIHPRRPAGQR
ncbi:MAG: hypothetical protein U0Q16_20040 [Bryobacteraceae bacterium]